MLSIKLFSRRIHKTNLARDILTKVQMELFWFVLFSFISSSFATSDVRIVNGTSAEIGEFPFVVSKHVRIYNRRLSVLLQVSLENKGRHFCGGTVLNKKYILTAAHCVCDVR